MGIREEKVVLSLEDNFTSGMAKAVTQTALLDKTLEDLDKTSVRANKSSTDLGGGNGGITKTGTSARQAEKDLDRLSTRLDATGRSARNASNDLNKYTGRLNLLVQGVALLGPALVPITAVAIPAVAGLTAGLGAAAGAFGVVALAADGMGDALKALDAYKLDPTTENLDKLHQAMANLGPDGRQFVELLDDLEPQLRAVQNTARAGLLPGVEDGIGHLLGLLPQVQQFVSSMSTELGNLASDAGRSLADDSDWQKFFTYLQTDGAPIMSEFAKATGNLTAGLADLMRDFAPLERDFATGLDHAAASFRSWADGLDETKGFHDFIDYIRDQTPQVIALLKSLGDAGLGLIHAIAPWGSTVLPIMTAMAKVFAALSSSPIGPLLYDAAAAMIVFNRSAGLLGLGGAAGLASGGGLVGTLGKTRLGFQGLATDIRTAAAAMGEMATVSMVAGANTEREVAMMSAAGVRLRTSTLGIGRRLAPAAGIGGTLLLANGLTTKNTAASAAQTIGGGALLGGSIGLEFGPEGAAIGAAIGALGGGLVTLATHIHETSDAVKKVTIDWSNLNATLDSNGNVTAQTKQTIGQTLLAKGLLDVGNKAGVTDTASITAASGDQAALDAALGASQSKQAQLQKLLTQTQAAGTIWNPQGAPIQLYAPQVKEIQQQIQAQKDYQKSLKDAAGSIDTESTSTQRLNAAMGTSTLSIRDQITALASLNQQILSNFDAVTSFGQAVQNAAKQAASGEKGLNQFTKAGADNRQALSGMIEAWNAQPGKVKNNLDQYEAARRKLVQLATQMGATKSQIAALARAMDQPKTLVLGFQDRGTLDEIAKIKNALGGIPRKISTDYYVNQITGYNKRQAMDQERHADGGLIRGPGGPRDDLIPALLSNREYVMPADTVEHYGVGFMDTIRARRLAGGGLVGGAFDGYSIDSTTLPPSKTSAAATKAAQKKAAADVKQAAAAQKAARDLGMLSITLKPLVGKDFKDLRAGLHGLLDESKKNRDVLRLTGTSLKDLNKASKLLGNSLTSTKSALSTMRSNRDSLESSITSGLMPDLFSTSSTPTNPFTPGATRTGYSPDSINAQIGAATNKATQFGTLLTAAEAKGLNGDALNVVLSQGGFDALQMFANAPASTVQSFVTRYTGLEKAVNADAVAGGNAIYRTQISELKEIKAALNKNSKAIEKAIKDKTKLDDASRAKHSKQNSADTTAGVKGAAVKGAKSNPHRGRK